MAETKQRKSKPFTATKAVIGTLGVGAGATIAAKGIQGIYDVNNIDNSTTRQELIDTLKYSSLRTPSEYRIFGSNSLKHMHDETAARMINDTLNNVRLRSGVATAAGIGVTALAAGATINKAVRAHKAKKIAMKLHNHSEERDTMTGTAESGDYEENFGLINKLVNAHDRAFPVNLNKSQSDMLRKASKASDDGSSIHNAIDNFEMSPRKKEQLKRHTDSIQRLYKNHSEGRNIMTGTIEFSDYEEFANKEKKPFSYKKNAAKGIAGSVAGLSIAKLGHVYYDPNNPVTKGTLFKQGLGSKLYGVTDKGVMAARARLGIKDKTGSEYFKGTDASKALDQVVSNTNKGIKALESGIKSALDKTTVDDKIVGGLRALAKGSKNQLDKIAAKHPEAAEKVSNAKEQITNATNQAVQNAKEAGKTIASKADAAAGQAILKHKLHSAYKNAGAGMMAAGLGLTALSAGTAIAKHRRAKDAERIKRILEEDRKNR